MLATLEGCVAVLLCLGLEEGFNIGGRVGAEFNIGGSVEVTFSEM
jgi:hypothetical protein